MLSLSSTHFRARHSFLSHKSLDLDGMLLNSISAKEELDRAMTNTLNVDLKHQDVTPSPFNRPFSTQSLSFDSQTLYNSTIEGGSKVIEDMEKSQRLIQDSSPDDDQTIPLVEKARSLLESRKSGTFTTVNLRGAKDVRDIVHGLILDPLGFHEVNPTWNH